MVFETVGSAGHRVTAGRVAGLLAGSLMWLITTSASGVPCDDVALPNKIFGTGGSALTATLKKVALAIANDPQGTPAEQVNLFYADPNNCEGYADFAFGKSTRVFKYWVAGQAADQTCEARAGGQPLDFGYLSTDLAACDETERSDTLASFRAPVQGFGLVTGLQSAETVISAEALYFIFGFGQRGQVSPWTDGTGVFVRQTSHSLTQLLGRAINVPAEDFAPWLDDGFGMTVTRITTYSGTDSVKAAQALGYASTATADANRSNVKTLAYQHYGQSCGVYPDSSVGALDKLNIRLGKYYLWNAGQFLARVDDEGKPLEPRVANLLGWFDGTTTAPGTTVSVLDTTIRAGDIPDCAMHAQRDGTLGALSSYAPPKPCLGRFELVATGSTDHDPCAADGDCSGATPACNFGFCETYRYAEASEG
jgi:hypothetical protein